MIKTHRNKQREARRNMTPEEIRNHTSIFQTEYWKKVKLEKTMKGGEQQCQ